MDRPRLIRGLRIAWSMWWGILCVLLVVLWVRSYTNPRGRTVAFGTRLIAFVSSRGRFCAEVVPSRNLPPEENDIQQLRAQYHLRALQILNLAQSGTNFFGFARKGNAVEVPHWFPVLVSSTFAAAPWIRWKFSLRTLLIATTLIAVVLGVVVWSA
jgi:hypothetical protein